MKQFYSPSMNENRGFAAINTKGEPVFASFSQERAYPIEWKFGPRRGVIRDDNGNKIVVVNNASGAIFTDYSGEGSQPAALFTPTLFKQGEKSPRKICRENENLFMLINCQVKDVDGYSVAKLDVANVSCQERTTAQSVHFIVFQNGVIVDAFYDKKTDLQLRRRLAERGVDVEKHGCHLFIKKCKTIKSSEFALAGHELSFETYPDRAIQAFDGHKQIFECTTWMETLAALYQLAETKDEFDSLVLPRMAKSLDGLIAKTLGVSSVASIH